MYLLSLFSNNNTIVPNKSLRLIMEKRVEPNTSLEEAHERLTESVKTEVRHFIMELTLEAS